MDHLSWNRDVKHLEYNLEIVFLNQHEKAACMVSNAAHHISKLNTLALQTTHGIKSQSTFFPAHSSQAFKNFPQKFKQNSSSADRRNKNFLW